MTSKELKAAYDDLMCSVLDGTEPNWRTEDGFIRWGRVANAVHKLIDDAVGPRDAALAARDEEIGRLREACESAVRGLDVICDHFALHGNSWDVLRIKNLRDKVSAALRSREAPDAG